MTSPLAFRPSVMILESRWLPTAAIYANPILDQIQASYVSQAQTAANPVVFLGDSITYNWGTLRRAAPGSTVFDKEFAPLGAANFGVFGDTTAELIDRIDGGDLAGKPKVAVVMIGVNDLIWGATPYQAAEGVVGVVQAIKVASPKTAILLLGVLPSDNSHLNPGIKTLDTLLLGMNNDPGVVYQTPGIAIEEPDGAAVPGLTIDGLHPDLMGYDLIANAIDGTIVQLLQEADYTADRPAPSPSTVHAASLAIPTPQSVTPVSPGGDEGVLIPYPSVPFTPADVIAAVTATKPKTYASEVINESTT